MSNKNTQIDAFLDYYASLPMPPQYAVMLRGNWGSGKTWFVRKFIERLEQSGGKALYVSLYGISSTRGIEDEFFRQLHPVLASKGMAVAGKVVKSFAKLALKVDVDGDGKDDGTASFSVPDIDLSAYMQGTEGRVLVFDDLERCSIPIGELLGYINYFVEHNGYKAVLVAHEEELLEPQATTGAGDGREYRRIKEKLVGKTFQIESDLSGAVESFVSEIPPGEWKEAISQNTRLIHDLYRASKYENLRHLRQALWDYARIVELLQTEHRQHEPLLQHLLTHFLIYSFEVRSGSLKPTDLAKIRPDFVRFRMGARQGASDSTHAKLAAKYLGLSPLDAVLPDKLWVDLMTTGLLEQGVLTEAINKNSYFVRKSQPEWARLWDIYALSDQDVEALLPTVLAKFKANEYTEIGVLCHVFGILLDLSSLNICTVPKDALLKQALVNVDVLKALGVLVGQSMSSEMREGFGCAGLGFRSGDTQEFAALKQHIQVSWKSLKKTATPTRQKSCWN